MPNENLLVTNHLEILSPSEVKAIVKSVSVNYGFDLSQFSTTFLIRRILHSIQNNKITNVDELLHRLYSHDFYNTFLSDFVVDGNDFFRDEASWNAIKNIVLQIQAEKQKCRVWLPKSMAGEDLYTLLVLLDDIDCLQTTQVLASNMSKLRIDYIKTGIYNGKNKDIDKINFNRVIHNKPYESYFISQGTTLKTNSDLINRATFLYSQPQPEDVDLIIFRNYLIYLQNEYQMGQLSFILKSLNNNGYLIIGINEQIQNPSLFHFKVFNPTENIFQKQLFL